MIQSTSQWRRGFCSIQSISTDKGFASFPNQRIYEQDENSKKPIIITTMTAPVTTAPTKSRSRKPPHPNSILDRQTLLTALDDNGLTIKAAHIDTFYQALHRQHYPDLPTFVANYYINEAESAAKIKESNNDNRSNYSSNNRKASSSSWVELQSPLKNAISTKKNRKPKPKKGATKK